MTIRSSNGKIYKVNQNTIFYVQLHLPMGRTPVNIDDEYQLFARNWLSDTKMQTIPLETFKTFSGAYDKWLKINAAIKNGVAAFN